MKYFVLVLTLLCLSCGEKSKPELTYKIQNNVVIDTTSFMSERASDVLFNQISQKKIKVSLSTNDGYQGFSFDFLIDKNKRVSNFKYDEFTDLVDGSKSTYSIDSLNLIFSHDPFEKKENKELQGQISVKVNATRDSNGEITSRFYYRKAYFIAKEK